ncbi:MAG: hypothetical protein JWM31_3217 [Solirubrobacterales bacterium]|nr:hypothetical protein [Solirubrobacterales bacterium]
MARQRNRQRQSQEAAAQKLEDELAAQRRAGRGWIIRALIAVVLGSLLGLVFKPMFAVGTLVALVCVGLALREGIRAQLRENAARRSA